MPEPGAVLLQSVRPKWLWAIAESHGKVWLTRVWPLCAGDKEGGPSDVRLFLKVGGGIKGNGRCHHECRDKDTSMTVLDRLMVL